jgi:putative transposase
LGSHRIKEKGSSTLFLWDTTPLRRLARTVFAHLPHHITQRGNRREDAFFIADDCRTYLAWLKDYCQKHHVDILAYGLMSNQIHLVGVPATEEGLQRVLKPLHMR